MHPSVLTRLCLCMLACGVMSAAAGPTLIQNGSFESGVAISGGAITSIMPGDLTNWIVSPSVVNGRYWWYMSSGSSWGVAQDGDRFLQPTYADESVSQAFGVTAGVSYIVSYYEALRKGSAGQPDSTTASIALAAGGATGTLSQIANNSLDNSSVASWQLFSFTFKPDTTTTATLRFVFNGNGGGYPVIDNAVVEVVPEPASLALFGLALLTLRRPRRAALRQGP